MGSYRYRHRHPFSPSRTTRFRSLSASFARYLTVVAVLARLHAAAAQDLRDQTYLEAVQQGVEHIYRIEHDEAIRFFDELGKRFPDHPGPPLARAAAIWLRELFARQEMELDRFISPGYFTRPADRQMPEVDLEAFRSGIEECQARAARYLERHPGNRDARYYLGAAEGALGVFAFTIDRSYMDALKHGKRSYEIQKVIIEEDPAFYDAYMAVGTYEYVLGNLRWYIKWIAALAGYRGSVQKGFEYLVLAADKGVFVSLDARVLLMVLYVREKEYEYGLQVARQLYRLFPENFLIRLNEAQILERMGEGEQAVEIYLDVIERAEKGVRNYQKLPLGTFRYTVGHKIMELGHPTRALCLFQRAAEDPETPSRERALSHLRAGECLDLLNRHREAIEHYEEVLRLPDHEGSRQAAGRYLKSPYRH